MKIAERILIVLALTGVLMKFNTIPGGSAIIVFSLGTLGWLYLLFGFLLFNNIKLRNTFKKSSYIGVSGLRLAYVILSGMAVSAITIGILFKLMYWPGADINLLLGIIGVVIVVVTAVIKYFANKEKFYLSMMIRFALYLIVGVVLFGVSSRSLVMFQYRNYPKYAEAFIEREEDPQSEEKMKRERIEYDRMFMTDEEFKKYHPEEE